MRDRSTKMLAVLMVSLMAVVALAPLAGEETDAAVGDNRTYSYTLTYHADQMANTAAQETQLTVDGMTPISHASGTTTFTALANEGSWSFNAVTGIGPFNSFYAAFDYSQGNKFVARLNPDDLTKTMDGQTLSTLCATCNIMWVVPTVYWSVDEDGNVILTNNPSSGGTAYAHTINGHVYKYIALGVYLGSKVTSNSTDILTSTSGTKATGGSSYDLAGFRTLANNNTMDSSLSTSADNPAYSMLMSYTMLKLYKLMAYTVMEGFDSQAIVGNGQTSFVGNTQLGNGLGNTMGPYAGNPGDLGSDGSGSTTYGVSISKLFIENPWGCFNTWIDGVTYKTTSSTVTYYIDTSNTPTISTTARDNMVSISSQYPGGSGYGTSINTSSALLWGDVTASNNTASNYTVGTADWYTSFVDGSYAVVSGGCAYNSTRVAEAPRNGLNYFEGTNPAMQNGGWSARLAFVLDDGIPAVAYSVSFEIEEEGYGTLSDDETQYVDVGSEITISGTTGNVLTIGENTITATPAAATSDYTYSFDGWFVGSTQLETGDTVDDDMTITAKFSRAAILTVTLDAGKGTVSSSSISVIEGQPIGDLPTPTPKAGYTFTGWFDSEGNEVTSETIVTETESFTLYAQYELDDSLKPVKAMTDLLPLIFVVGIIILMIGTAFYYYRP